MILIHLAYRCKCLGKIHSIGDKKRDHLGHFFSLTLVNLQVISLKCFLGLLKGSFLELFKIIRRQKLAAFMLP